LILLIECSCHEFYLFAFFIEVPLLKQHRQPSHWPTVYFWASRQPCSVSSENTHLPPPSSRSEPLSPASSVSETMSPDPYYFYWRHHGRVCCSFPLILISCLLRQWHLSLDSNNLSYWLEDSLRECAYWMTSGYGILKMSG